MNIIIHNYYVINSAMKWLKYLMVVICLTRDYWSSNIVN